MVLLPQYSDVRIQLYNILKDYPIIRSRISQFNTDFSDKQILLTEIERFTQRISWHLKRLYRTRNAIIHAGQNPPNLKALAEHLHSYVDSCLVEIITLLATEENLKTIDNVIINIQLNETKTMHCLQEKGKMDRQAIAIRTINIPEQLIQKLRQHRAKCLARRLQMGKNYTDTDFIIVHPDGKPIYPEYVSQMFTKLQKKANLPKCRFHDLRHLCASIMFLQGVDVKTAQKILGHKDFTTTMNIYTHVFPSSVKEAAEKVGALVFAS